MGYIKSTFILPIKNPNELDSPLRISIHRSDFPLTKLLLSQPLFVTYERENAEVLPHQAHV